jgi:hypothetical protein
LSKDVALRNSREAIGVLETKMGDAVAEGVAKNIDIPVQEIFWGGIYGRTICAPEGAVIVGHIHKYNNLNLLLMGELELHDGAGNSGVLAAPAWFFGLPGEKKVAKVIKGPAVWTTFHPTNETETAVIEKIFISKSEEDYQQFLALAQAGPKNKWLG